MRSKERGGELTTATVNYKKSCANNVFAGLKAGFRHIDAAEDYENVSSVGEAVRMWEESGGRREDLFITTKCASIRQE